MTIMSAYHSRTVFRSANPIKSSLAMSRVYRTQVPLCAIRPNSIRTLATKAPAWRTGAIGTGLTASTQWHAYVTRAADNSTKVGSKASKKKKTTTKGGKSSGKTPKKATKKTVKTRKGLTEKQKEALKKKQVRDALNHLKIAALQPPKSLPSSPLRVYIHESKGNLADNVTKFKALPPADLERLGEIASANKQTNQNSLQAWVEKHSPLEIRTANIARRKLSRTLKKQVRLIPDARQVKLPKTAYIYFASERMATPEFQQKPREMLAKLGQAWKALSESEKEKYQDLAKRSFEQYVSEYRDIYKEEPSSLSQRKSKA